MFGSSRLLRHGTHKGNDAHEHTGKKSPSFREESELNLVLKDFSFKNCLSPIDPYLLSHFLSHSRLSFFSSNAHCCVFWHSGIFT